MTDPMTLQLRAARAVAFDKMEKAKAKADATPSTAPAKMRQRHNRKAARAMAAYNVAWKAFKDHQATTKGA